MQNQDRDAAPESNKKSSSQNVKEQARNITQNDIKAIQAIGRKSIFDFTSEDISKVEFWAKKFWTELGTKSPFFRAWFGDWRVNDFSKVLIINVPFISLDVNNMEYGTFTNKDTNWDIYAGSRLKGEDCL